MQPNAWHIICWKGGERVMADLEDEIAAYDAIKADLETKCLGKWQWFTTET
jgi:hypothetical protein